MREDRIAMLQDTLRIFGQGYYTVNNTKKTIKLTPEQLRSARVYLPNDIRMLDGMPIARAGSSSAGCRFGCENIDSFSLALRREAERGRSAEDEPAKPVLVLNLANPVHPGGGVRSGARAQEEDLCRKSSLLLSLEGREAAPYYTYNRSLHTFMGSDAVIIHPQVEIIKDENGVLLPESVIVSVLTCAAPMVKRGMEGMTHAQYQQLLFDRITGMLKAAAHCGYRRLILGAFGCGAFGNDARIVSGAFQKAFEQLDLGGAGTDDAFDSVDFAVLDRSEEKYNYNQFSRRFSAHAGSGAQDGPGQKDDDQ